MLRALAAEPTRVFSKTELLRDGAGVNGGGGWHSYPVASARPGRTVGPARRLLRHRLLRPPGGFEGFAACHFPQGIEGLLAPAAKVEPTHRDVEEAIA